jgi:hypothetical protein
MEVSPTPAFTPEPTVAAVARAAEDSVEAPSPEPFAAVEQPPEAPLPEPTSAEPAEEPQEVAPDRGRVGGVEWLLLGVGLLSAGLLVVTLLARRFGW